MEKTGKQLRKEREKLIMDAIALKPTERVPVSELYRLLPGQILRHSRSAAYYDYDAWYNAYKKTLTDFQPDMIFVQGFQPGKALEILDPKNLRWPGHGVEPNQGHQSIELNNLMKADEYADYMEDPSDFMLRVHEPRISENLEGLAGLPPLSMMGGGTMGIIALARSLGNTDVWNTFTTLRAAGREFKNTMLRSKDLIKWSGTWVFRTFAGSRHASLRYCRQYPARHDRHDAGHFPPAGENRKNMRIYLESKGRN